MNNFYGILLCFLYIFTTIGLAEGLRRWHGYSSNFTRKFIHIGVGMMSWFIHYLFDSPWPFALACVLFMIINLLGGTIIVERVFALPGIGSLALDAGQRADIPAALGAVTFLVFVIVVINLTVDAANGFLNPKVRTS